MSPPLGILYFPLRYQSGWVDCANFSTVCCGDLGKAGDFAEQGEKEFDVFDLV